MEARRKFSGSTAGQEANQDKQNYHGLQRLQQSTKMLVEMLVKLPTNNMLRGPKSDRPRSKVIMRCQLCILHAGIGQLTQIVRLVLVLSELLLLHGFLVSSVIGFLLPACMSAQASGLVCMPAVPFF
mmetsp:Transcript_14319/g.24435  ORF Transcript_14319/g.24435 Transcript_14319/m.24435 type:complete len:127 (+) Transcript_14319:152-532(+)